MKTLLEKNCDYRSSDMFKMYIVFSTDFFFHGHEQFNIFHQARDRKGEGPSPGCYNKIPQTGGLNNRHVFLTILEAETSKIRCQQIHSSCLGDSHLLAVPSQDKDRMLLGLVSS